ncbi:hypothetical protein BpHYR1_050527 [Brachionus plicatilis]|uniref:Uncharacterized protein n=1 Tax=Brachionus plicatilis TaxID=10195 RepID=A0A3M7Q2F5_BRAPC|nr:hypothetical protein BpHYR1_050527 [Brachionus plicatilis]
MPANHLHEFYESDINVNHFNQQGLEKYNDITTATNFRGSNQKKIMFEANFDETMPNDLF